MITVVRNRLAAGAALVAAVLAGPAAPPSGAEVSREAYLTRGAEVVVSSCSFDAPPITETRCDVYLVLWAQIAFSEGGRPDLSAVPWGAYVEHHVNLERPDGTGETLLAEVGFAPTDGSFDSRHRSSASMDAVDVPMFAEDRDTGQATSTPTGNTVHLGDFTWTASSPTYVWGSDGPKFDAPRHLRLPCGHLNLLAHQKVTFGAVSGTIDGRSIDDLFQLGQTVDGEPVGGAGAIFDNALRIHVVDPCVT